NNHMFDLHLALPVPMSVLIDSEGRLVALYKGAVAASQVLADASVATVAREARREQSVPFAGRWHEPINRTSHVPLLDLLVEHGLLEEADDFVRRIGTTRKSMLLPAIVRLGMAFYNKGDVEKANEHLSVVRRMEPSFVGAENAMAMQREKEGRYDQAIQLYSEAIRRSPNSITALNNLAWVLATCKNVSLRNGSDAVKLAERAVEIGARRNPAILGTLVAAYAETGQFDKADAVSSEAIEIAKAQGKIREAKELTDQQRRYSERRHAK
ncbi:MAG: tetratricopeptide repeat protein, partial [Planctomycetales bacterium]|nr:tetratricopeptide repeat protein [Planctomycetales bacterium]